MGKGSKRRPCCTTKEEQNLRDRYARGLMTFIQYERAYRKLMKQGKIKRNGKMLNIKGLKAPLQGGRRNR